MYYAQLGIWFVLFISFVIVSFRYLRAKKDYSHLSRYFEDVKFRCDKLIFVRTEIDLRIRKLHQMLGILTGTGVSGSTDLESNEESCVPLATLEEIKDYVRKKL